MKPRKERFVYLQQETDKVRASYERGEDYALAKREGAIAYGVTADDIQRGSHNLRLIYALDEFSITEFGNNRLYRFDTTNCRGLQQPLIKISAHFEMVYYMTDDSVMPPKFETRGTKWQYLIVIDQDKFFAAQDWLENQ